ncbi:MAG TPA: DUF4149 domain-containing protein [Rhodocyclaceae bacterium]|nr:DUF4149 domain-containing protein [Rhodocyclaceae bacterium]
MWLAAFYRIGLTFWVGGSWVLGYLVVPALFSGLGDRQLAGVLAGKLFAQFGLLGLVLGVLLALYWMIRAQARVLRCIDFWLIAGMLVLAAAGCFWLQPGMAAMRAAVSPQDIMQSALRERFVLWHGISSILYLAQSLLGLWAVLRSGRLEVG